MLNLTRQERLVIQFLALFFVIGSAIHLIREKTIPGTVIEISEESSEAAEFRVRAEKVDSLYLHQAATKSSKTTATETVSFPGKINLNTATMDELITLPKIGEVTAQRIIEYRIAHNGFKKIDDLINVKGIGRKTLERLKNEVCIE